MVVYWSMSLIIIFLPGNWNETAESRNQKNTIKTKHHLFGGEEKISPPWVYHTSTKTVELRGPFLQINVQSLVFVGSP